MISLGLFSQLSFFIVSGICSQIDTNYQINTFYYLFLVYIYAMRVVIRIINMFFMKMLTHIDRIKICALLMFLSYFLTATAFVMFDLNNDPGQNPVDENGQEVEQHGVVYIFFIVLITHLALLCSALSSALAESTIVGYLKCFHPDQIEEFGTGASIASIGDILTNFWINNFQLSTKQSQIFFYLSLSSISLLYCFNGLDNLRAEYTLEQHSTSTEKKRQSEAD